MVTVVFVGLGLNDESGLTLEGLEESKKADAAFAEFYTNLMPNLDLKRLEDLIGKKITVLNRTQLEDDEGKELLSIGQESKIVFFVPGDPMIATTHISLRLSLSMMGVKTRIVHAASIVSAICGATGLQSYKFGKSITVPYEEPLPNSVLETISENHERGLHTLVFLDVKAGQEKQLSIHDALSRIDRANPDFREFLAVGVARLGALNEKVKGSRLRSLIKEDFGAPPHSIVAVGKLHFMEAEALKVLCGVPDEDIRESK
jgi:diphthine synthase